MVWRRPHRGDAACGQSWHSSTKAKVNIRASKLLHSVRVNVAIATRPSNPNIVKAVPRCQVCTDDSRKSSDQDIDALLKAGRLRPLIECIGASLL